MCTNRLKAVHTELASAVLAQCFKESIMKAFGHPAARAYDGQRYHTGLSIRLRVV